MESIPLLYLKIYYLCGKLDKTEAYNIIKYIKALYRAKIRRKKTKTLKTQKVKNPYIISQKQAPAALKENKERLVR